MIIQSCLMTYSPNSLNNIPTINDSPKSQPDTHIMKNHIVFCPKCGMYVGATDKGDYYLGSRRKHKIKKEVLN